MVKEFFRALFYAGRMKKRGVPLSGSDSIRIPSDSAPKRSATAVTAWWWAAGRACAYVSRVNATGSVVDRDEEPAVPCPRDRQCAAREVDVHRRLAVGVDGSGSRLAYERGGDSSSLIAELAAGQLGHASQVVRQRDVLAPLLDDVVGLGPVNVR